MQCACAECERENGRDWAHRRRGRAESSGLCRLSPAAMVLNIKNKIKREQVFRKLRREHTQSKLKARVERAELEKKDPALRAVRFACLQCSRVSHTCCSGVSQKMCPRRRTTCETRSSPTRSRSSLGCPKHRPPNCHTAQTRTKTTRTSSRARPRARSSSRHPPRSRARRTTFARSSSPSSPTQSLSVDFARTETSASATLPCGLPGGATRRSWSSTRIERSQVRPGLACGADSRAHCSAQTR